MENVASTIEQWRHRTEVHLKGGLKMRTGKQEAIMYLKHQYEKGHLTALEHQREYNRVKAMPEQDMPIWFYIK